MGDWKIGSDRRRRSTDQLHDLREANDGELTWDTTAPADFTFLYHPHRVLVRADDVDDFERAVSQLDKGVLGEPPRRDDVRLLDGELVRYLLVERVVGLSVPELLDLLEEAGLRPGAASPDHWVHVSPGGGSGNACPATEPQETGLTEPWPPAAAPAKGREVSVVVVDTGWHPPAATDPRTPWLAGVEGDDELNGPELRPYAGHGTFIAGVVRCVAPQTKVFVEGFAIGGIGGGGILESDLVLQLEEALTHDPQVINLSAGCRTRMDHPSIALELFHRTACASATACSSLPPATTPGPRRSGRPPSSGASASGRSTVTAACRTSRTSASRPTSTPWAATSSTPSPTAPSSATRARTRGTSASSAPASPGGAARRSPRRWWPG